MNKSLKMSIFSLTGFSLLFMHLPATQAADGSTGSKRPKPRILQAKMKTLSKKHYVYKNGDEDIDHELTTQRGQLGPYTLDEELNDGSLIHYKLSLSGKKLIEESLPKWKGLCEPHFYLTVPESLADRNSDVPVAADINNDGVPELIVGKTDEGPALSPDYIRIIKLDKSPTINYILQTFLIQCRFEDPKKNGIFEIISIDDAFRNWNGVSSAESRGPSVIHAWNGKAYTVSVQNMKKQPPGEKELAQLADKLNLVADKLSKDLKGGTKAINSEIWSEIVSLVYSGNARSARQLLKRIYPAPTTIALPASGDSKAAPVTADEFWSSLVKQCKSSKYARYLQQLNPEPG